jgi:pimeloyl-ACP methyl ester carboxylesterase
MKRQILYLLFLTASLGLKAQIQTHNCPTLPVKIQEEVFPISSPDPLLPPVLDTDGDGVPDDQEEQPFADCDNDGVVNYLDTDSDNDGIGDLMDQCDCAPYADDPSGCPPDITDRKVWWLHGYKGSEYSFQKVGDHVMEEFEVQTRYPSYNASEYSLSASAANVERDIRADVMGMTNTNRNFIVAHSMGGLVARKMGLLRNEVNNVPLFNGLITFGTPHLGAAAADILVDKPWVLSNAVEAACNALSAGPLQEEKEMNIGLQIVGALGQLDELREFGCELAAGPVIDRVIKPFAMTGVERDLTTRNNGVIPPMATGHNAVFYGIEDEVDDSLFPRFLGALSEDSNEFELFGAGESDSVGLNMYGTFFDHYHNKMELYNNGNPFDFVKYIAFKAGVLFLNMSNDVWKELIGALTTEMVSEPSLQCVCVVPSGTTLIEKYRHDITTDSECDDFQDMINSDPANNEQVLCRTEVVYDVSFQKFDKPSDGFILAESAKNGPGMNYELQVMPGSNHMQMKNDKNMEKAVKAIWFDGLGRRYFYTKKR